MMKNKVKITFSYIFLIIAISLSAIAIYLSARNGSDSSNDAGLIVDLVSECLGILGITINKEDPNTIYLIRKLIGHYSLFLVIGLNIGHLHLQTACQTDLHN